jgi:DNA-binding transcriptional LysR family regulator
VVYNGDREQDGFWGNRGGGHSPVREPEVAELRAFCAAATLGSIAAAARSLHVSQPALSKRLRGLEAVAGARLFDRSTRGVTLTAEGAHLYGAARRLLTTADTVHALMRGPGLPEPVRIASTPVIAQLRLPEILADLAVLDASLSVDVIVGSSTFVREMLREERCDLGIAAVDPERPPDPLLRGKVLWRDEVVVAVPPQHPWKDLPAIPVEEFASTELVQNGVSASSSRIVAAALEQRGLEPSPPAALISSPAAVMATALATHRPALISMMSIAESQTRGLVIKRVSGMNFDREFALLWRGSVPALGGPVLTIAQYMLDLPFARSRTPGLVSEA